MAVAYNNSGDLSNNFDSGRGLVYADFAMKIMFLSDAIVPEIYSESIARRFDDVDLVIGLGDLPYWYYDFVMSMLNCPLYYVRGNHDADQEPDRKQFDESNEMNIHGKTKRSHGLTVMGFEGSYKYTAASRVQYTEMQMSGKLLKALPRYLWYHKRYRRSVELVVAHSPPAGISPEPDLCHRGFKCFRRFIETYQPDYFVHGHIHIYDRNQNRTQKLGRTKIINACGYYVLKVE